ncbi:MAG: hypothetical protein KF725_00520 [Cyclobacteriaceae bacterium]|nr:hypothetical protein [Cyclobacteriaceae bacterium]UYN87052.1 MAG: hypothetical protein KIT51_01885 [Cyclobacteriaceae bacterium]
MRNLYPLFLLLAMACSSGRQENSEKSAAGTSSTSFTLSDLQGEWQQLTEQDDGSYIIFRPCDADNMMVQVNSDTLMIGWGQDASFALIKSFYIDEAGRLVLSVHDQDENLAKTYYMQWEDDNEPITGWFFFGLDERPVRMAHESILYNYTVVQQPCSECWDDCEEEE